MHLDLSIGQYDLFIKGPAGCLSKKSFKYIRCHPSDLFCILVKTYYCTTGMLCISALSFFLQKCGNGTVYCSKTWQRPPWMYDKKKLHFLRCILLGGTVYWTMSAIVLLFMRICDFLTKPRTPTVHQIPEYTRYPCILFRFQWSLNNLMCRYS